MKKNEILGEGAKVQLCGIMKTISQVIITKITDQFNIITNSPFSFR